MTIKEQLEEDINTFLENVDKQLPEYRKKSLLLLMDKYMSLFSEPTIIDRADFDMIKTAAITFYKDHGFPKKIGNKGHQISKDEANILCVAEATISILNKKECLKNLPKFDYRD